MTTETGPTLPWQSLLTRVIGVLTSPGATFKAIVAHPMAWCCC
jgi:hypothetical protein